ncbi:MAG: deoxyribose-phosphate aldolase [Mycoplasma sp.]
MKNNKYAKYIDHTILSQCASKDDVKKIAIEATENGFKSICINPSYVALGRELLKNSEVLVCTVIGFPLGQNTTEVKVFETKNAVDNGAQEIDMVINISKLKERDMEYCINEINQVVLAANGNIVKVIVETCLLTEEEKIIAFDIVNNSKAQFIKTSTGFSIDGAKIEDIKLWNDLRIKYNSKILIKAAGGVRTSNDLELFIEAGANRIGTSKGVALMSNEISENKY